MNRRTNSNKLYYAKNKLKENKRCRNYYHMNLESQRERCRLEKKVNRKHYSNYMQKKRTTDDNFRIASYLRRKILQVLKSQTIHKKDKYGINYNKIVDYLNKTKPKDYILNPKKYSIDHIKPLSKFNLKDIKEIKKANSFQNLRWLELNKNLGRRDY